jgi:undecaprenyl diphosphate synthase
VPIDDTAVANAVSAPSPREPDLVVILGPPTHLPTSLVWELAYSELVFLDLGWTNLTAADLELAVDDFTRRNRRFGGLDS